MPTARETHDAWALQEWERFNDNLAQRERRQPEYLGDLIALASVPVEYWPEELKQQLEEAKL